MKALKKIETLVKLGYNVTYDVRGDIFMYNVKKLLMTISMTLALSFSILGTQAHAVTSKTRTDVSSQIEQKKENKTNNDKKNSTSTSDKNANKNGLPDADKTTGTVSNSDSDIIDDENENQESVDAAVPEKVVPHWEYISGYLHYVTEDGIVEKQGWFKEKDENPDADNDNEYFLDKNSAAVTGWEKIGGNWYYFNEAGVKQTGWQLINYNWYCLDEDGIMQKGWTTKDGYRYYMNDSGSMVSGKKYIDGNWYFFANDGRLQTSFYTYNGKDYYSNKEGVMVTNQWIETKNNRYYAKADSSIAKGNIIIDGVLEYFDDNGRYVDSEEMDNYLYVRYLNVGNADCSFIKLPNGETALIDTGDVTTRDKLVKFLNQQDLKKKNGKKYIDYVIVTHGHSDHIGGLEAVLENFKVGKIYMPKNAAMENWYSGLKVSKTVTQADIDLLKYDYQIYKDAAKAVKSQGLKFTNPTPGQYIDSENILQFVQSGKDFGAIGSQEHMGEYWGINENSAIVYLNYGDFQSLFTADMEWNSEKHFWVNDLLNGREVDLLKVPHHGYDTSSTGDFLKYVNASVGVISRDGNSIEHNTAYNNLLNSGVTIYETSQSKNGGVAVYSTEDNWSMADFNSDNN